MSALYEWHQLFKTRREFTKLYFDLVGDYPFSEMILHELIVKPYKSRRSLAQNRLYWKWLKEIADYINESTGTRFTDEDMHDYFKTLYLDSELKNILGEKIIRYKSTAKLSIKRFSEYLESIEFFAGAKGIPLTRSVDFELATGKRK